MKTVVILYVGTGSPLQIRMLNAGMCTVLQKWASRGLVRFDPRYLCSTQKTWINRIKLILSIWSVNYLYQPKRKYHLQLNSNWKIIHHHFPLCKLRLYWSKRDNLPNLKSLIHLIFTHLPFIYSEIMFLWKLSRIIVCILHFKALNVTNCLQCIMSLSWQKALTYHLFSDLRDILLDTRP